MYDCIDEATALTDIPQLNMSNYKLNLENI